MYVFAGRAEVVKGEKALSLLFFLFFSLIHKRGGMSGENTSWYHPCLRRYRVCMCVCGCGWVWVHACTLDLIDTPTPRLSFLIALRTAGMSRRRRKKKGLLSLVCTWCVCRWMCVPCPIPTILSSSFTRSANYFHLRHFMVFNVGHGFDSILYLETSKTSTRNQSRSRPVLSLPDRNPRAWQTDQTWWCFLAKERVETNKEKRCGRQYFVWK